MGACFVYMELAELCERAVRQNELSCASVPPHPLEVDGVVHGHRQLDVPKVAGAHGGGQVARPTSMCAGGSVATRGRDKGACKESCAVSHPSYGCWHLAGCKSRLVRG